MDWYSKEFSVFLHNFTNRILAGVLYCFFCKFSLKSATGRSGQKSATSEQSGPVKWPRKSLPQKPRKSLHVFRRLLPLPWDWAVLRTVPSLRLSVKVSALQEKKKQKSAHRKNHVGTDWYAKELSVFFAPFHKSHSCFLRLLSLLSLLRFLRFLCFLRLLSLICFLRLPCFLCLLRLLSLRRLHIFRRLLPLPWDWAVLRKVPSLHVSVKVSAQSHSRMGCIDL